ncbi:srs domain-containing protein [Neospora caninum Liverpool]|uniref:Srs domain-containing protein n=1 Tax=Neospora caninum (strain Liverpool) TaxID=572307 RepID=F0VAQ9_NEOCL|nr:srs domain-containing protein [Neospora caninum Liverpool]CBZ51317.1 srs domain-containing protein [Neospora caninum Liverpool]CEL68632.1 TPA: SRS domain-containing protein [Neospora caninum Liverpool]|eukprot:XP_003881350.1 srs domain-containing protein [Neospora caninum Liverpool]
MERRMSWSFRSGAPVIGLVAAVLFVSCSSGLWRSEAAGTLITPQCDKNEEMTTCTCGSEAKSKTGADGTGSGVTLSESSNGIAIQCPKGNFEFVPSEPTKVCTAAEQNDLQTCQDQSNSKTSPIQDFLAHFTDNNVPQWTKTEGAHRTTDDHSLAFPTENFPLVDKSFFVGCRQTSPDNGSAKQCVVNVSVKARTSAVKNGVLICAYGNESNESVPEVTLNSQNNSLTIQCGSEGQMEPTQESLTAYHCSGSNADECTIVNLTEVMPDFTSSWWTTDSNSANAPKLVIPEDGFPAQEETIVLGCNQKVTGTSKAPAGDQTAAAGLPTCTVKVTLGAQTSGSQASNVSFHRFFGLISVPLVLFATY